jgi:hypothetical protein
LKQSKPHIFKKIFNDRKELFKNLAEFSNYNQFSFYSDENHKKYEKFIKKQIKSLSNSSQSEEDKNIIIAKKSGEEAKVKKSSDNNKNVYDINYINQVEKKYESFPFISSIITNLKLKVAFQKLTTNCNNRNFNECENILTKEINLFKLIPGNKLYAIYCLVKILELSRNDVEVTPSDKIMLTSSLRTEAKKLMRIVSENTEYFNSKEIGICYFVSEILGIDMELISNRQKQVCF